MNKSRTLSTAPFLIFVVAYTIIGLFFLVSYTRIPGFHIGLLNSASFVLIWPLFLAGWLSGANFVMFIATLSVVLMHVFFQTRFIYIAGKSRIKLLVWPVNPSVLGPVIGLLASHTIFLAIDLLGGDPKFGISIWTFVPSAYLATPVVIFLIFRGLFGLFSKKRLFS